MESSPSSALPSNDRSKPNQGGGRRRQSLSQLGGRIALRGPRASAQPLAEIMEGLEAASPQLLTHGFHTYPARFHPLLVRRLLERYAEPGDVVLDPFLGGGTTVVEALVAGCLAVGTDINPVALRVARVRATPVPEDRLKHFLTTAQQISDATFHDARKRISRPLGRVARGQRAWYAPHVLLELQGLFDRIQAQHADPALQELAWMTFSSLLVKVSKQRSDSAADSLERQVGRGTTSRLFGKRAEELCTGLRALAAAIPPGTAPAVVRQGDARAMPGPDESVDLIITSPPYVGTFDYLDHQARRFDWLGEDLHYAAKREIGARRDAQAERQFWIRDEQQIVAEMARVLKPGGRAFIVAGDGLLGGKPHIVDEAIGRAAERCGLRMMAVASQVRPHVNPEVRQAFRRRSRREHLVSLKK